MCSASCALATNRSARLLEDMEKAGLVSALTASGQREVLVPAREG